MAVSVVAAFEVIDVDHGNGIRWLQSKQGIMKGAPGRQGRQFVVISEQVGRLDDCACQDEGRGREISGGDSSHASKIKREKASGQRPQQSALCGLVQQQKACEQQYRRSREGQQRGERQRSRQRGMM